MKLAARAGRIVPSPTLSITATAKAMAAQGIDVVDFASGEPDFDTPDVVKAAAELAIRTGFTKYTPASGIDELKLAIVKKLETEQGLRYDKSQILISCGAKHTLYNIAEALFEQGDEVIIPAPFWVSYPDQILLNDATPVFLETKETEGYVVRRRELEAKITPRTKAIIINSPCNPTGATYDRACLQDIAEVAQRHDLVIISDEIYEKIVYDSVQHISIATLGPDVAARTVIVNGVSKAYCHDGMAYRLCRGPERAHRRDGQHTKSEHVEPDVDIAKSRRRRAARGRVVHANDVERVRPAAAHHGGATQCDARRDLSHADGSFLCFPKYLRSRPNPYDGKSANSHGRGDLLAPRSESGPCARRTFRKRLAYSALVCDEHGRHHPRHGPDGNRAG